MKRANYLGTPAALPSGVPRYLPLLLAVLLAGCAGGATGHSALNPALRNSKSGVTLPGPLYGINSNSANGHSATWVAGNVVGDRSNNLDVEYSDSPATVTAAVARSLADGCRPMVIINVPDSTLLSNVSPSAYAKGAKAIIGRVVADHPTVRNFELINEPWNKGPHKKSNASDYANLVKTAYEEVATLGLANIGLLVAGFGTYELVDGNGEGIGKLSDTTYGGGWISDLAAQQPTLKETINGWTSHPYGAAEGPSEHHDGGMTATEDQRNDAGRAGFNLAGRNNWWITEVGFEIGGTGPASVTTEAEQASETLKILNRALKWHDEGWLQGVFIYDDGSTGFNIYGRKGQTTLTTFASEHK